MVFSPANSVVSKAEDLLVEKKSQELLTLVTSGKVSVPWDVFSWGFPKIVGFPPKSFMLIGCSIINHPFWGT